MNRHFIAGAAGAITGGAIAFNQGMGSTGLAFCL